MNLREVTIIRAALAWWKSRRPVRWSRTKHLLKPTVNTTTAVEKVLAEAVADWINVTDQLRWDVWTRGYGLHCDVDGVLYVYRTI